MSFIVNPDLSLEKTTWYQEQGQYRSWYHEDIQHRDCLLITAGDSWTWGDSLSNIDIEQGVVDDPKRVTSIYGHLLAQKLNADLVNLAKCGGSNIEIHDYVVGTLKHACNKYKKVFVVLTLTENYRESNWDPIWMPDHSKVTNLEMLLEQYEHNMFTSIKTNLIDQYPDVTFLIGRNFTYSFDNNKGILGSGHLSKTWVDCLAEAQNKLTYPEDVRMVSAMSYVPLIKSLKNINLYKKFKFQFMEHYALAELAIDWLLDSDLNYKKSTKHPTEQGHEIWADYLYKVLK